MYSRRSSLGFEFLFVILFKRMQLLRHIMQQKLQLLLRIAIVLFLLHGVEVLLCCCRSLFCVFHLRCCCRRSSKQARA